MTKDQKIALANHLEKLGKGTIEPIHKCCGLCSEIMDLFGVEAYLKIKHLSPLWTRYSGHPLFPVPHPTITNPSIAYSSILKWGDNQYGNSRRELCLFLAETINNPPQFPKVNGGELLKIKGEHCYYLVVQIPGSGKRLICPETGIIRSDETLWGILKPSEVELLPNACFCPNGCK